METSKKDLACLHMCQSPSYRVIMELWHLVCVCVPITSNVVNEPSWNFNQQQQQDWYSTHYSIIITIIIIGCENMSWIKSRWLCIIITTHWSEHHAGHFFTFHKCLTPIACLPAFSLQTTWIPTIGGWFATFWLAWDDVQLRRFLSTIQIMTEISSFISVQNIQLLSKLMSELCTHLSIVSLT